MNLFEKKENKVVKTKPTLCTGLNQTPMELSAEGCRKKIIMFTMY